MKPAIGMIGIGLMGHGIACNIAEKGYRLTILDHPGNQPTDDLRAMGVQVAASIADVTQAAEIVILCVTGSPQVEAILSAPDGVIANLRPGMIVLDCSTALPDSTARMSAAVMAKGARFMDAAMTRLPKNAREGTLNLLIGGDATLLEELRPLLTTFAENITHIGGVGDGHRMKLLHNYVSLGFMTLLAEVSAHAEQAGIAASTLINVLAEGGGGGAALTRMTPFLLTGDPSNVSFFIRNAAKDLTYYRQTAIASGVYHGIADAVGETLDSVVTSGHGDAFVPQLAELLKTPKN